MILSKVLTLALPVLSLVGSSLIWEMGLINATSHCMRLSERGKVSRTTCNEWNMLTNVSSLATSPPSHRVKYVRNVFWNRVQRPGRHPRAWRQLHEVMSPVPTVGCFVFLFGIDLVHSSIGLLMVALSVSASSWGHGCSLTVFLFPDAFERESWVADACRCRSSADNCQAH